MPEHDLAHPSFLGRPGRDEGRGFAEVVRSEHTWCQDGQAGRDRAATVVETVHDAAWDEQRLTRSDIPRLAVHGKGDDAGLALDRRLPIERLAEFGGAGIYYAATEIEARHCKGTQAVIVGGGNSAGQAAMYPSRFARCAHVLVRGRSLAASMSSYLSSRLEADPKIALAYGSEVVALHGSNHLEGGTIRDVNTGAQPRQSARDRSSCRRSGTT